MEQNPFKCHICGKAFEEIQFCFGGPAPYYLLNLDPPFDDENFSSRVELTADQCVVDEELFFIRGHIILPITDYNDEFIWSVWCSISKESFIHMTTRWNDKDRVNDEAYFGWLMTPILVYPKTIHLNTSVKSREVGIVPIITVMEESHPLFQDQKKGITLDKAKEYAHNLLHT